MVSGSSTLSVYILSDLRCSCGGSLRVGVLTPGECRCTRPVNGASPGNENVLVPSQTHIRNVDGCATCKTCIFSQRRRHTDDALLPETTRRPTCCLVPTSSYRRQSKNIPNFIFKNREPLRVRNRALTEEILI